MDCTWDSIEQALKLIYHSIFNYLLAYSNLSARSIESQVQSNVYILFILKY